MTKTPHPLLTGDDDFTPARGIIIYMSKHLEAIEYGGKSYPVLFKQTRKWSHTTMKKIGMVYHATTSGSYTGGLEWLVNGYDPANGSFGNGGSALFVVGRNVGEIAMLGEVTQKLWHAGRIANPAPRFLKIAKREDTAGRAFVNPNLYLDGVEFVGGIDRDKSGKVTKDEVNLTEWQYACGVAIAKWHAEVCGYELTPETQITHQDIASDKPDLSEILDELLFRLFKKSEPEQVQCAALQAKVEQLQADNMKLSSFVTQLVALVQMFIKSKLK